MKRHGFTLIELLAAMAILAVVSVMAVQALGGALIQRDILARRDDHAAELIRALALLRHDLEAVAPLPEAEGVAFGVRIDGERITLRRSGIAIRGDVTPGNALAEGFGNVHWALSGGVLTRAVAPDGGAEGAPVPILTGARAMRLVALGEMDESHLPPGFELTFETESYGPLRLVVAR